MSTKLEILHNEDKNEYEEMVTEEAEAEDWMGSLMRAAGLGSFRADGGQYSLKIKHTKCKQEEAESG